VERCVSELSRRRYVTLLVIGYLPRRFMCVVNDAFSASIVSVGTTSLPTGSTKRTAQVVGSFCVVFSLTMQYADVHS